MTLFDHDRRLLAGIDRAMDQARKNAGDRWGCGPGRTDCCIGPFPINLLDARRLCRGLEELERNDPERAETIRERARYTVASLQDDPHIDAASGLLSDDEGDQQTFCDRFTFMPCPALNPSNGTCEVYAHRPWTCRTYGPPLRQGEETLPACPDCFAECTPEETESLRVEPDPEGLEDTLVDQLQREERIVGDTVVAYALLGFPRRPDS